MAGSLAATAARGSVVMLTGQGMRILLQFLSVVTLARLLSPHDYGLIAIVAVLIGVGEIFRDFGLSSAAVRAPELSRAQSGNLFWINSAIGLLLAALLFGLAGPLAAFLDQEEVYGIARAMSVVFLLNGATTQYRALIVRGLRFRWLAGVDVLAAAFALAVALLSALLGWEYWALVAQQITQAFVVLIGVFLGVRHLPGLPRRGVPMASFLRFGGNLVLSQLVTYATSNVDTAVVGVVHGASPLGLYNRAYQLVVTPLSQIQSPITQVAVPILAKIQEDRPRFSAYIVRGQFALGYPISLGLATVAVAAEPFTVLLLGEQWTAAVPLLQLFALAGIARNLAYVGYWVYVVRGLSASLFRYSMVTGAIKVLCVVIGAQWGVVGVAIGFAIAPWIAWPISLAWLSRVTDVPTRSLYAGALRIIGVSGLSAGMAAVVVAALPPLPALAEIAIVCGVVLAMLGALLTVPAFRRDARVLKETVGLLRHRSAN
ncbi:lipopolysaccharide biosynthesis protein [Brachybacterium sp. AOP43-C2-M15]|uniref:lipopolysaccharide biosynthesis protein n=1 Tax=Brachybacterium sp. AOP43-C2-M15 TaxID=3457661 RepID=UPI0040334918